MGDADRKTKEEEDKGQLLHRQAAEEIRKERLAGVSSPKKKKKATLSKPKSYLQNSQNCGYEFVQKKKEDLSFKKSSFFSPT